MDAYSDLERLGDEIAELSAQLEAATARLLDRIREFDAREGWNPVRNDRLGTQARSNSYLAVEAQQRSPAQLKISAPS